MRSLLLSGALLVGGCVGAAMTPRTIKPAPDGIKTRIVVLKSSANTMYQEPSIGFADAMDGVEIVELTLEESTSERAVADVLSSLQPTLIYALGARAALLAAERMPDTPVVCAMAVDYRASNLHTFANVSGVALETPPVQEFSQFKMVVPKLTRVLVLHSAQTIERVTQARAALRSLDIELEAVKIESLTEIPTVVASRGRHVDAVWFMNDPLVFNRPAFVLLRDAARSAKIPILASLSAKLADDGALAAVSFDYTSVGAQAASLARSLLAHAPAEAIRFQPPMSVQLTLNLSVAKQLALDVSEDILPLVRTVGSVEEKGIK